MSSAGFSNYQNPILNQSINGPLSTHSGYGIPQSHHTSRSESNFANIAVHNPLLTQGKQSHFQFNKTLFEAPLSIRIRSHDRDDYMQLLHIKIIIHATSSSNT